MSKVFLDTSVLVYAYDASSPVKQHRSLSLLDDVITSGQAVISAQVLGEFYVASTQKLSNPLSPQEALERIDRYTQCIEVVPITAAITREAARAVLAYHMSFWDAQIWAAAHLNQIPTILTEDIPGTAFVEGIRYHNPFETSAG